MKTGTIKPDDVSKVINMIYGAISLDTGAFIRYGLRFDSDPLLYLHQFKSMHYPLVLPDIVLEELKVHLEEKITKVKKSLENVSKDIEQLSLNEDSCQDFDNIIKTIDSTKTIAEKRLHYFLDDTGAEVLNVADDVKTEDLFSRYFDKQPPFELTGKKTKEFPDAAALLSLESWAKKNETKILVVSSDKGWEDFAEKSMYLDLYDANDLTKAISSFLPDKDYESAKQICESLAVRMNDQSSDINSEIFDFLVSQFGLYYPAVITDSSYHVNPYQGVEVTVNSFEVTEDSIIPVQLRTNVLVVEVELTVKITASAELLFSVYDSIDKDYTFMGSSHEEAEQELKLNVLFTFKGNLENVEEVNLTKCSLLDKLPNEIHFGHCGPDFYDEYDE